jgi:hypothetical protein
VRGVIADRGKLKAMKKQTDGIMIRSNIAEIGPEAEPECVDADKKEFSKYAIYLARTIQNNTLTLSQMADNKASILIGATFVVFSLAVTKLIGTAITWAIASLAGTAFISSMCAVLALLPSTKGSHKHAPGTNLLFFGNFVEMDEREWKDLLIADFRDDEAVFRLMLRDVHQNGSVLHRRKFRYINLAYRVFLIGIVITMITFLAELIFDIPPIAT